MPAGPAPHWNSPPTANRLTWAGPITHARVLAEAHNHAAFGASGCALFCRVPGVGLCPVMPRSARLPGVAVCRGGLYAVGTPACQYGGMLDHLSIQCADVSASAAFYDSVLAPLGGVRVMDFGSVIGYGVGSKPDFWLGPRTTGDGFRESHMAFAAPDRAGTCQVK
jgi:hypothetical protein